MRISLSRRKENDDASSATNSTATGSVLRRRAEETREAGTLAGQAETVLDVMEQESKLR